MQNDLIVTIITSAAVGALASAIVNLFGQLVERRARRRELLLTKAIELAARRTDSVLKIALERGLQATLRDEVSLAADYYQILQHIMDKRELPESFEERERASLKQ